MISECHQFRIVLMENSESGWNPERYRHCMRGGTAHDESRSLEVDSEKAVRNAYDTQVRRPAQIVKVYLLSSYGEMGYFVAKKTAAAVMYDCCFLFWHIFSILFSILLLLFRGLNHKKI